MLHLRVLVEVGCYPGVPSFGDDVAVVAAPGEHLVRRGFTVVVDPRADVLDVCATHPGAGFSDTAQPGQAGSRQQ